MAHNLQHFRAEQFKSGQIADGQLADRLYTTAWANDVYRESQAVSCHVNFSVNTARGARDVTIRAFTLFVCSGPCMNP